MTRICFLDTETTGLALDDDIWEFAAIVRQPDGTERTHQMFIEHDTRRCNTLPPEFLADHQTRFPISGDTQWHPDVKSRKEAAHEIAHILSGRPHIVGAVPNFDTERIARLLRRFGLEPDWHHHLIDVEAMAVGWGHGVFRAHADIAAVQGRPHDALDKGPTLVTGLPWNSDTLSRSLGVDPADYARHTALGDALWVRAQYDAITKESRG